MDMPLPGNPSARPPERSAAARWYVRVPCKWAAFVLVGLLVCFPNPVQFVRHVRHLRDLQAMIEPNAPELRAWTDELISRTRKSGTGSVAVDRMPPRDAQREIERFVLDHVKYEWDWNLWGSADYMPTLPEMFEKAKEFGGQVKEDCDGRAVMAASLMAALGYQPTIVTDLRHVWVTTPEGEWMGPGGAKTMIATSQGTKIQATTLVANIPISLSYGIAVFPFFREFIILLAAFVLMLRRWSHRRWAAAGFVLLIQGLLFLRLGFFAPEAVSRQVSSWPTWVGLAHVCAGFATLVGAGIIGRRRAVR